MTIFASKATSSPAAAAPHRLGPCLGIPARRKAISMQITANTSGMLAGLAVASDRDGRDHCVVVVKGTFSVHQGGTSRLAEDQQAIVYADQHYGDPGSTSIQYECDFPPFKPRADVVVNGVAFSPNGSPVREMLVGLQVGPPGRSSGSQVTAFGTEVSLAYDRRIQCLLSRCHWSMSVPTAVLINPMESGGMISDLRNLVGVGFYIGTDPGRVLGRPLPNLEDARTAISSWSDRPPPTSFGVLARGWQPRVHTPARMTSSGSTSAFRSFRKILINSSSNQRRRVSSSPI